MQPHIKPQAEPRSAHAVWLMAGGFVFMVAMSLEWLTAIMHGVPMTVIHEHTIVPAGVHALAIASIPISLFPVLRRRSRRRSLGTAAVIAPLLLTGQTLATGFLVWVVSAAILVWQRRQRHVTLLP